MTKRSHDSETEVYSLISQLLDRNNTLTPAEVDTTTKRIIAAGVFVVTIRSPTGAFLHRVVVEQRLEPLINRCNERGWAVVASKLEMSKVRFRDKMPTDPNSLNADISVEDWEVIICNNHTETTKIPLSGRVTTEDIDKTWTEVLNKLGIAKYMFCMQARPFPRGMWSALRVDTIGFRQKLMETLKVDGNFS